MKLLGSSRSPYVRKVRVMFEEKGIAYVCVPEIRFCNIGGEGRRELGVT
jgi:glutathione S-transferase